MEPDSLFTFYSRWIWLLIDSIASGVLRSPIRPGISEKSNIIEEPLSRFRRVRPIDLLASSVPPGSDTVRDYRCDAIFLSNWKVAVGSILVTAVVKIATKILSDLFLTPEHCIICRSV